MALDVASKNPFALLGGDEENDDPQKIMLPPEPAPAKHDQPPEGGDYARGGLGRGDRGGRGGRASRGGGGGRRGDYQRNYGGSEGYDASELAPVSQRAGRYGPGRGDERRGRGRGAGRVGAREGKQHRDYDRRDQSGRGHEVEKRAGGGKGNWGGATDAWEETPAEETQPDQNGAPPADGEAAEGENKEVGDTEGAEEKEKAEEAEKLTLAEYEELTKEKKLVKVCKKVEVDKGQFKGLSQLVKDEMETGFEALELEKTKRMKPKTKKEFIPVETGFRVGDPVRRGRGRGLGRGGRGSRDLDREGSGGGWGQDSGDAGNSGSGGYRGRGRGPRGDRRSGSYGGSGGYGGGYRSQPKQPSLDDQTSFPSLS